MNRGVRWAARAQFFCSGFIFATWGVHVPTVKAHYGLDEAQLGLALLAAGFGALGGLAFAGRWVDRWGPRRAAAASGAVYALLLSLLLVPAGYAALLALLAAFGLATSVFDVAINTEAAELERLRQTPLMSGMHGMFSLGGMSGALTGAAALGAGLPPATHLLLVALANTAAVLAAAARMRPGTSTAAGAPERSRWTLPRGPLLALGALAALGLVAEGAMYDWSVLFMQQELASAPQQAALAYASFSAAMAAARFGGDALRARWPPRRLLCASALLAAAAMALVLLSRQPGLALLGFAGVGIGFANVVPLLFAAAARNTPQTPAHGIAAVSAAAYLGFMVGPPAIGLLAQSSSLSGALWVVVLFALTLAAGARHPAVR